MAAVSRRTLTEKVADAILDLILEERVAVGLPLPSTSELADRFDVSVVVVREAMAILAGRGIVVRRQGRESVVARPGPDVLDSVFRVRMRQDGISLEEFHQCRAALELQSAALAATRHDRETRAAALSPALEALRRGQSLTEIVDADQRFHVTLAELTSNHALQLIISSLNSLLRTSIEDSTRRVLDRYGKEGPALTARIHERVADAVIAGDRPGAIAAMADHFLFWRSEFDFGSVDYAREPHVQAVTDGTPAIGVPKRTRGANRSATGGGASRRAGS